jgi:broad-specificity NMP kinase
MTRQIIAIAGVPGTGKTTLMRHFMNLYTWERQSPAKLVETMYCKELDLHILGKYEDGEVFAGTDKLSMACQPEVTKWLQSHSSNVMYEGDRLTGQKFYDALLALPDTEVTFIVLKKPAKEILEKRYAERGSDQNETFLAGRASKIDNILSNFDYMDYITEVPNENEDDMAKIINLIEEIL